MDNAKFLILGLMPPGIPPDNCYCAGPWCFEGQEKHFPNWESRHTFAPEPLTDPDMCPLAAKAAQALCVKIMPKIAERLCPDAGAFPSVYWDTLLSPWAIAMCSQIVERSLRVSAMIKVWGNEDLIVPLMEKDCEFNFVDEQDFNLRGTLGDIFNFWLLSRMLEFRLPSDWEKVVVPSIRLDDFEEMAVKPGPTLSFSRRTKESLRSLSLNLRFPPLKGISLDQALKFSRALNHPCKQEDKSLDLAKTFGNAPALDGLELPEDLLEMFMLALPQRIKKLNHNPAKCEKKSAKPSLRVASIRFYEDAFYRQKMAIWRAKGNRLAFVQHGGNYGMVEVPCTSSFVEYSQDVFFTWGWEKHGDCEGNFIPVPYPQLCGISNAWKQESDNLLFVGAEMAAYPYRLDSRPTPLQFIAYREDKAVFLKSIGLDIAGKVLYRPYFPLPGTFEDAPWLRRLFPKLQLCEGPLLPHLLGCRLLVMDHHGTTLLEAMAANVPMILYWDPVFWPMDAEGKKLLGMMKETGIWHETPDSAAKAIVKIWQDPGKWWATREIQEVRAKFCERFARHLPSNPDEIWIDILKKL